MGDEIDWEKAHQSTVNCFIKMEEHYQREADALRTELAEARREAEAGYALAAAAEPLCVFLLQECAGYPEKILCMGVAGDITVGMLQRLDDARLALVGPVTDEQLAQIQEACDAATRSAPQGEPGA